MIIVLLFIVYIIVSLTIVILKGNKSLFYLIPLFVMLEITNVYLSEVDSDFGVNGLYLVVMLIFLIFNFRNYYHRSIYILFSLIALLAILLIFNFSPELNIINSLSRTGNFIFILLLIPFSIMNSRYIKSKELFKIIRLSLIIYIVYVLLSSIFKYGPNHYNTDIIYGFKFEQWYFAALGVVLYPVGIKLKLYSKYEVVIFFVLLLISLLVLRRTVWVIIVGTFVMYLLLDSNIKKNSQFWIILLLTITPILFLLNNNNMWNIRSDRSLLFSIEKIEDESRYQEYINTFDILLKTNSLMLGTGYLFDEHGRYDHKNPNRSMHGTYSRILFGVGLIGIFLYLLVLLYVLSLLYFKRREGSITCIILSSYTIYLFVALTGASGIGLGISYIGTLNILAGFTLRK